MQENTMTDPTPIFTPIHSDIISQIRKDVLSLHSAFWLNSNKQQEIHVLLSSNFITLCQKNNNELNYLVCAQINFDLKFQVVCLADKAENFSQDSILSKPIGFRLMKQNALTVEFEIVSNNLLPIWIKYLGKMLNQVGFHKMFKPQRKLGKGGFATVYEVQRLTDGKLFAVKAFSKQSTLHSKNQSHKLNLLNEIKMMRSIEHPNLIKLEGIFESQNSLYVVLELLNHGHLHKQINIRKGSFNLQEIRVIMEGLIKGLKHLAQLNIMHRDIKPENIMLKENMEPVLVDFGLSTHADSEDYIFYRCGTPGYVAPEVTTLEKGKKISPICDMFSLGVIFHILLVARPLFEGKKFQEVYDNNKHLRFNLNAYHYNAVNPQAMDLLTKMLQTNPNMRISPQKALKHPFFHQQMVDEKSHSTKSTLKQKISPEQSKLY